MKITRLTAFAFTLLCIVLAACGSTDLYDEYDAFTTEKYDNEHNYTLSEDDTDLSPKQAYFLKDLDYMLYVFENNFALFDVAYWHHGVDIRGIIDDLRIAVINNPDIDVDEFFLALNRQFSPLRGVAHFAVESPANHFNIMNNPAAMEARFFDAESFARFSYPHVLAFYEPRHPDSSMRGGVDAIIEMLRIDGEAQIRFAARRLKLFGEYELAEEIKRAFQEGEYLRTAGLMDRAQGIMRRSPNVATEILEENRIAYLSINSFDHLRGAVWDSEVALIHDFLDGIRDFEHLIIDLQRNSGGIPQIFYDNILRPNISEPVQPRGFAFAVRGTYMERFLNEPHFVIAETFHYSTIDTFIPVYDQLWSISDILNEFDLPDLRLYDMERMHYGWPVQTPLLTPLYDEPVFGGKIWLLTGPHMGSAAQIAAFVSMETGFATHVGDITGGNYGGPRTVIALPNTGIVFRMDVLYVTDRYGRPLEAGTVPHHFNREGMNALETALALIAEGEY